MKRKVAEKKQPALKKSTGVESTPTQKSATKRAGKYLSAKFTRDLVDHLHRAKKAALQGEE